MHEERNAANQQTKVKVMERPPQLVAVSQRNGVVEPLRKHRARAPEIVGMRETPPCKASPQRLIATPPLSPLAMRPPLAHATSPQVQPKQPFRKVRPNSSRRVRSSSMEQTVGMPTRSTATTRLVASILASGGAAPNGTPRPRHHPSVAPDGHARASKRSAARMPGGRSPTGYRIDRTSRRDPRCDRSESRHRTRASGLATSPARR